MILDSLRDFDWINEPEDVSFTESGLQVTAQHFTDFWQNVDGGVCKDNGHFFANYQRADFVLDCRWFFENIKDSAQCGIMVRVDEHNWLKLGLLSPNIFTPQIGIIVANRGSSDWSMYDIPAKTNTLWFKLKRCRQDFVAYYSLDGEKYQTLRMTHLAEAVDGIRVGAYACSPKNEPFDCVLEELSVKSL